MLTARSIPTRHGNIRLLDSSGRGLPLLMIHGSGACKEVFARQLHSPLAEQYRTIALDLPGHGASDDASDPAATYSMPGLAAAVVDVIEALEIKRLVIAGWSLGGHVGIEVLGSHPAVAGLMLTGTPPVASGPLGMLRGFHAHWDLLLATKEQFTPRDAMRFRELCFGDGDTTFIEAIKRADGRLRTAVFRSMMRGEGIDQRRAVERSNVPVAMVNGAHDPFVRLGYLSALDYQTLWDERCHVIAATGHAPFWTAPQQYNALLARFLHDADRHSVAEPQRLASRA
jgi:pimeloyl-ACP methyl ester carboxylesterase